MFRPIYDFHRLCCMRGDERVQDEMFSCVTLEQRVPQGHPLREIRRLTDAVLISLNDNSIRFYAALAVRRLRWSMGYVLCCCRQRNIAAGTLDPGNIAQPLNHLLKPSAESKRTGYFNKLYTFLKTCGSDSQTCGSAPT